MYPVLLTHPINTFAFISTSGTHGLRRLGGLYMTSMPPHPPTMLRLLGLKSCTRRILPNLYEGLTAFMPLQHI